MRILIDRDEKCMMIYKLHIKSPVLCPFSHLYFLSLALVEQHQMINCPKKLYRAQESSILFTASYKPLD